MDHQMITGLLSAKAKIYFDEPMKNHTSFRIGGPAEVLIEPASETDISNIAAFAKSRLIPLLIMGNGTDLLVSDRGISGIVLKTCGNMDLLSMNDPEVIEAQCGALLSKTAKFALKSSLAGLEFASGIPGSIGGAVYMNAGAYGGEMSQVVLSTRYMDKDGNIKEVKGTEHQFGYRKSVFTDTDNIVLSTRIGLKKSDPKQISDKMEDYSYRRREKQPIEMPSAGSVFKRPEGHYAAKLIEDCGLKGRTVGGAMVSPKHCGFIVNTGGATAQDVITLIEQIKNEVYKKTNVELECEIKLIGIR